MVEPDDGIAVSVAVIAKAIHGDIRVTLGGTPRDEWHQWGRTPATLDDWRPTGGGDAGHHGPPSLSPPS